MQDYKVTVMFSSPTALRVLKKQDPAARWIAEALGKPVYDHFWQTETGWALISGFPGVEDLPTKFGRCRPVA